MSDLTGFKKHKLEKALRMGNGYVLDFSNPSLQSFVYDSTGLDILDEKYSSGSGSKANRLRTFWEKAPNHAVGKLITDLLEYRKHRDAENDVIVETAETENIADCLKTAVALSRNITVENLDSIQPINSDKDFNLLSETIRKSIEDNQPEVALDRLHTFLVKYVRELCGKHGIKFETHEALHGIFGKYVKHVVAQGHIKSIMSERILKFSINVIDGFNEVRNSQSFAHDNPILNYDESILILVVV
ncbi:abortive infection family protein [Hymenobacter humi]|uniref:Abortive infection family protein n=1 Tax=Hymenobacter humi TaxID=1411620 RepID=A0ABW2U8Z8_9BACT